MKTVSKIFAPVFVTALSLCGQNDYKPMNLGPNVNSTAEELRPFITADGKTLYMIKDGHAQNVSTQDVWYCNLKPDSTWSAAEHPGKPFNRGGSNSAVFNVSPDNTKFLIRGAWDDGESVPGISYITKKEKGFSDPVALVINNYKKYSDLGNYNGAYMAGNGKVLLMYFSDKNNSNKSDIYVSFLVEKEKGKKAKSFKDFAKMVSKFLNNDTWTEPKSLGSVINEYGSDEMAPFIASDMTTLYFSSSRAGGYGSNDIYMSKRLDDTWTNWSPPVNLGPTINSDEWDSFYSLDARGEYAYMVSSKNSLGGSDIVKVKLKEDIRPNPVVLISGFVYDAKTNKPIGANIEYENLSDGKNAGFAASDPATGEYKIVLPYGKNYGFLASSEKFISVSDHLDLTKVEKYAEIRRDLYLVPFEIGQTVRLNNIFFDTGKDSLRPESFPELDRLVTVMTDNDKMQIEISGHTDNVGKPEANLKLSDARAKAVMNYVVNKGIKAERITSKGFGETKPVGTNDTDDGKQLNRRVEFTIIKN